MKAKGTKSYFALTKGRRRLNLMLVLLFGLGVVGLGYLLYLSQAGSTTNHPDALAMHIHIQLEIVIDARLIPVPAQIGVTPQLWHDHSLDMHGSMNMSPLHTHDPTGLIHIESRIHRDYTLGEFFRVWGQPFDAHCILNFCGQGSQQVTMRVNGLPSSEFEQLRLQDGMKVRIEF